MAVTLPLLDLWTAQITQDSLRLSLLASVASMGLLLGWTVWKIPSVIAARDVRSPRPSRPAQGASS
jgi:hypothetical protein